MEIVWPVASFNGSFESVVAISVGKIVLRLDWLQLCLEEGPSVHTFTEKYFTVGHCVQTSYVPYSCV